MNHGPQITHDGKQHGFEPYVNNGGYVLLTTILMLVARHWLFQEKIL
jgi:hypothetical protein